MLTWLLITACRDVSPDVEDPDGSTTTTAEAICESDDECPNGTICETVDGEADCVDGDRNNDPSEAIGMLWEDTVEGVINPSGDTDYYSFSARGGEYVRIVTTSEFADADTVLVLRDDTGQVLTWSDDFPTGSAVSSLDSVIYAFLPYEGEYLISVEDYYAYMDPDNAYGTRDYDYEINLSTWSQATQEPDIVGESLEFELDGTNMWNSIGVVIDTDGDSDWIEIDYTAKDEDGNDAKFLGIAGMVNLDGSDLNPVVKLYNESQELLAEIEGVGANGTLLYPDMSEGKYYIEIVDANNGGSITHWTYVFLIARANTPYPLENSGNSSIENAQAVEMVPLSTDGGNDYTVGRQMGYLSGDGSADWFSVTHDQQLDDGQFIVCLNSSLHGSTAMPLVELFDETGNLLSEQTCDPDAEPNLAIVLDDVELGQVYLSVSSEDATGVPSDWYQFLVYSTSFEASSYGCP